MKTEIEFLKQLEADLRDATARERGRLGRASAGPSLAPPPRRRSVWARVAGAAAAFLVVAGAIGFLAGGGADMFPASQGEGAADGPVRAVGGREPSAGPREDFEGFAPPAPSPAPDEASIGDLGDATDVDEDSAGAIPQQQDLSKIFRDGRIGVVIGDGTFGDVVGDLTFIAEEHRGFILSSSTQNERSGTFVLRIPARRFDAALADVRDLGDVRFQTIEGEDVTAEFIDYRARLRILQAQRALLFDLFQGADTTDEILRLASQLDDVRLRIEQIQGQIRFINDQVAMSTLRVSVQERNAPRTASRTAIDNPDLGSSFDLAIQGFLRIVGAVIVGLGYLIPLTILGLIAWVAVRLVRRPGATV